MNNYGGLGGELQAQAACGQAMEIRRASLHERLKDRLANHVGQQKKIETLLGLLERNPDFEQLLNLMGDIGL